MRVSARVGVARAHHQRRGVCGVEPVLTWLGLGFGLELLWVGGSRVRARARVRAEPVLTTTKAVYLRPTGDALARVRIKVSLRVGLRLGRFR